MLIMFFEHYQPNIINIGNIFQHYHANRFLQIADNVDQVDNDTRRGETRVHELLPFESR